MTERRKSGRFTLAYPVDAHVTVLQHVQVEHVGTNIVTVLSMMPGVRGEEVSLHIGPSDGEQATLVARTVGSEPNVRGGRVMHRIRLARADVPAVPSRADTAVTAWRSGGHTAVILRPHTARVVNLGRGGCLLELASGLPVGTVGTLSGESPEHAEPFRVGFLRERRGVSHPYAVGAEFLWLSTPSSKSFRTMAARLEWEHRRTLLVSVDRNGQQNVSVRDAIS